VVDYTTTGKRWWPPPQSQPLVYKAVDCGSPEKIFKAPAATTRAACCARHSLRSFLRCLLRRASSSRLPFESPRPTATAASHLPTSRRSLRLPRSPTSLARSSFVHLAPFSGRSAARATTHSFINNLVAAYVTPPSFVAYSSCAPLSRIASISSTTASTSANEVYGAAGHTRTTFGGGSRRPPCGR